jgi:hypothetical protein
MPPSRYRRRAMAVSLILACALGATGGMAENGGDAIVLDALPPTVAAATWCAEDGPGFATRRVFAGHVIFAVACPGNHANFIQTLVAADDEEGRNPRALVFPTPFPAEPDNPNDALSNIRWHEGGVISDLFVDPEAIEALAATRRAGGSTGPARSRCCSSGARRRTARERAAGR